MSVSILAGIANSNGNRDHKVVYIQNGIEKSAAIEIGPNNASFETVAEAKTYYERVANNEIIVSNPVPNTLGSGTTNYGTTAATSDVSTLDTFISSITDDVDISQLISNLESATTVNEFNLIFQGAFEQPQKDARVRLKSFPGLEQQMYGSGPSSILFQTNGLVFPYTPVITVSHNANYGTMSMTHSNMDYQYYTNSPTTEIQVSGRFTAANTMQAFYVYGVMHFITYATKMRFGSQDALAGLPPPVFLLDGHGEGIFNNVPVVIKTAMPEYPNTVDYVKIQYQEGLFAYVPTDFSITLSLIVKNTHSEWKDGYNWEAYRDGQYEMPGGFV